MELRRKLISVPITKSAQRGEDGFLVVRGFFTSDNKDEVGDTITRSATMAALPKYRRWGNIRRMHAPDPVGKVTAIGEADGLQWNEVEIKVIDPKAAFEVENGLLQALSVGILIKIEDIELDVDDGWIIHNYELAEISLVDHPANYDAFLQLDLSDSALRQLVREKGFLGAQMDLGAARKNLAAGEKPMNEKPAATTEVVDPTPVVAEAEKDLVETTPVVETTPAEVPVVETEPVEKGIEETQEVPAVETPAVAPVAEAPVVDPLKGLIESVNTLTTLIRDLVAGLKPQEAVAEVPPAGEQSTGGEVEDRVKVLEAENASLKAELAEAHTPTNREGAIKTELPTEEPVEEPTAAVQNPLGLKGAIALYMKSRSERN